jgi:DNA-binding sugar fermentation-stimulating protein
MCIFFIRMLHILNNPIITEIIKRPSATCKTPYVADIIIANETILAHTPALGCCGLSDKGCSVIVSPIEKKKNKCKYSVDLAIVQEDEHEIVIGIHPKMGENLVAKMLSLNCLSFLHNQSETKREVSYLNSRFDYTGIDANGVPYVMEVKNVPLADYVDVPKKERKKYAGIEKTKHYTEKIAYFPDGYRKNSTTVVSPRALKHVEELAIVKTTSDHRAILCFVVQRPDVMQFQPSNIDLTYKKAVQEAWKKGVEIYAVQVEWNKKGECSFIRDDLPVVLFDTYGPLVN